MKWSDRGIIANTIANIISVSDPAFASVLSAVQLAANFIPIVGPDRLRPTWRQRAYARRHGRLARL